MAVLVAGEGHYPLPRSYPFKAYALVSMPNEFSEITRAFGSELGLGREAQRAFERQLEGLAGRSITDFTGARLLSQIGRPALILHSRDDDEVPFDCADRIAATVPNTRLEPFEGLGHRAILYAPPVVKAVASFLAEHSADVE